MLKSLLEDLEKSPNLCSDFNFYLPCLLNKVKFKAIARKSFRQGLTVSSVVEKLLENPNFKKIACRIGKKNSQRFLTGIVAVAIQEEMSERKLKLLKGNKEATTGKIE